MKFITVAVFLFVVTINNNQLKAYAYSTRAGTCAGGPAIKDAPSFAPHSGRQPISLGTGGFVLKVGEKDQTVDSIQTVSPNADVSVGVGKDYQIVLQSNGAKYIKGFLFRMESSSNDNGEDAEGFFTVSNDVSQILSVDPSGSGASSFQETTCDAGVAAMCHTNKVPALTEQIVNFMNANNPGTYILDVTVVVTGAEWYYDSFTFLVAGSTDSPSMVPSFTPSSVPLSMPSEEPSTMLSAVPSSLPSFVPSLKPSAAPSTSARPSSLRSPSAMPSVTPSALPSAMSSTVPSAMPSVSEMPSTSTSPSTTPSGSPSVSTEPTVSMSPSSTPSSVKNDGQSCCNGDWCYTSGCSVVGGISNCMLTVRDCNMESFLITGGVQNNAEVIVDENSGSFKEFSVDQVGGGATIRISKSSNVEEIKFTSISSGGRIIAPSTTAFGESMADQGSCLVSLNNNVDSRSDGAQISRNEEGCNASNEFIAENDCCNGDWCYKGGCFVVGAVSSCTLTVKDCNMEAFLMVGGARANAKVIVNENSGSFSVFYAANVTGGATIIISENSNVEEVKFTSISSGGKIIAPSVTASGGNIIEPGSCLIALNSRVSDRSNDAGLAAGEAECDSFKNPDHNSTVFADTVLSKSSAMFAYSNSYIFIGLTSIIYFTNTLFF